MLIDGQFHVAAEPQALMRHLFDARLMAECLPGCESLQALDGDRYRAVVAVALAGVTARFDLLVQVTERGEASVRATTQGEEGGNASQLQADSRVTLAAAPGGTLVSYQSEVAVTGRLGRFALGMMKKKAQALGDGFARNLQARLQALEAGTAGPAAAAAQAATAAPSIEADSIAATSVAATSMPPASIAPAPEALASGRQPWWRALWRWLTGQRAPAHGAGG